MKPDLVTGRSTGQHHRRQLRRLRPHHRSHPPLPPGPPGALVPVVPFPVPTDQSGPPGFPPMRILELQSSPSSCGASGLGSISTRLRPVFARGEHHQRLARFQNAGREKPVGVFRIVRRQTVAPQLDRLLAGVEDLHPVQRVPVLVSQRRVARYHLLLATTSTTLRSPPCTAGRSTHTYQQHQNLFHHADPLDSAIRKPLDSRR